MGRNRNEDEYTFENNYSLTSRKLLRLQPLYDLAEICAQKGITEAILCPGSRCAPLTTGFARHPQISTRTISDERSAGFMANGIALAKGNPTVLVCTSGSASYNFAPAVAEAFFQQLPLIVFTADRPKEWIDQLDGQTIRQHNIYGQHVKKSFELPQEYDHPDALWYINRIVNEAINFSNQFPKGPVHINVPLREPFYAKAGETITFTNSIRIITQEENPAFLQEEYLKALKNELVIFNKILIVAGQGVPDEDLITNLDLFSKQHHIPVVADCISNLHPLSQPFSHSDAMLGNCTQGVKKALQPELLITFGKSVISKNLKLFLRKYKPQQHWHIQPAGEVADTFQALTKIIPTSATHFFQQLASSVSKMGFEAQKRENFYRVWEAEDHRTQRTISNFFSAQALTEFHLVHEILKKVPEGTQLHVANSMPVRYVNLIGMQEVAKGVGIYCNRGTSGIDGCTSTAVGHALASENPVLLITGDMAFFYDRNAFWHNYKIPNLRVVVLNNHGGTIFSMIDGPSGLPEFNEYFITEQRLTAKSLCSEFDIDYLKLDNLRKLKNLLNDFFDFDGRTKLLEIETDQKETKKIMDQFKLQIQKNYE